METVSFYLAKWLASLLYASLRLIIQIYICRLQALTLQLPQTDPTNELFGTARG